MTTRPKQISLAQLLLLMLLAAVLTIWVKTAQRSMLRYPPGLRHLDVAFSSDGKRLYSLGCRDVAVFETKTGHEMASFVVDDEYLPTDLIRYDTARDVIIGNRLMRRTSEEPVLGDENYLDEWPVYGVPGLLNSRSLMSIESPLSNDFQCELHNGEIVEVGVLGDIFLPRVAPILRRRNPTNDHIVYEINLERCQFVSRLLLHGDFLLIFCAPKDMNDEPSSSTRVEVRETKSGGLVNSFSLPNSWFPDSLKHSPPDGTLLGLTFGVSPSGRCAIVVDHHVGLRPGLSSVQSVIDIIVFEGVFYKLHQSQDDNLYSMCVDDDRNVYAARLHASEAKADVVRIHPDDQKMQTLTTIPVRYVIPALSITDSGRTLLVGQWDGTLLKLDPKTGAEKERLTGLRFGSLEKDWLKLYVISAVWAAAWGWVGWRKPKHSALVEQAGVQAKRDWGPLLIWLTALVVCSCAMGFAYDDVQAARWLNLLNLFFIFVALLITLVTLATRRTNWIMGVFALCGNLAAFLFLFFA